MADSALKEDAFKHVVPETDAVKVSPEQSKPEVSTVNAKPAENQATNASPSVNEIETLAQPKEALPEPPKAEEKKVDSTPSAIDQPPSVPVPPDVPAPAALAEPTSHTATYESVPDPDEDDLDDLDDVLDEFAATKLDSQPAPPAPPASGPGRPTAAEAAAATTTTTPTTAATTAVTDAPPSLPPADAFAFNAGVEEEDFARQLQAGMADLLGELESSPEMQKQFEDMLRELGGGAATAGGPSSGEARDVAIGEAAGLPGATAAAGAAAGVVPPASFQESISRTMERMQESGNAAATAAANSSQSEADFLAAMLREMEAGGEGSDEDFSKMLLGMMEQLTNKEILYEPMKELDTKFPEWMEKNHGTVPEADMKRYETQQKIVKEIVQKFEEPGYTDENVDSRKYIVDRMQQMQSAGSPPSDLVGDMDAAHEALGELDGGCPTQ